MKFERGQDPKDAMKIGIRAKLEAYLKEEHPKLSYLGDPSYLLRICAENGKLDFVQYLVEKESADVHDNDDHALRWAACNGHLDVVKYLVEHGATITANNNLAWRWAKENGHQEVYNYLENKWSETKNGKFNTTTKDIIKENLFYPRLK